MGIMAADSKSSHSELLDKKEHVGKSTSHVEKIDMQIAKVAK